MGKAWISRTSESWAKNRYAMTDIAACRMVAGTRAWLDDLSGPLQDSLTVGLSGSLTPDNIENRNISSAISDVKERKAGKKDDC